MKSLGSTLVVIAFILIFGGFIWVTVFGPCELYMFSANKDVPARCISSYQK